MNASAWTTTGFRVLLAAVGVVERLAMTRLLLRVRSDPPGAYTSSVVILSLDYGPIGVSASALLRFDQVRSSW